MAKSIDINGHTVILGKDNIYRYYGDTNLWEAQTLEEIEKCIEADYKILREKKKMNNFIAVCTMSNWGGLGIISIEHVNDTVTTAFDFGNGMKNISTAKIRTNTKGEDYFIKFGRRHYIRDFMRV